MTDIDNEGDQLKNKKYEMICRAIKKVIVITRGYQVLRETPHPPVLVFCNKQDTVDKVSLVT